MATEQTGKAKAWEHCADMVQVVTSAIPAPPGTSLTFSWNDDTNGYRFVMWRDPDRRKTLNADTTDSAELLSEWRRFLQYSSAAALAFRNQMHYL